jgi:hypothetical protein
VGFDDPADRVARRPVEPRGDLRAVKGLVRDFLGRDRLDVDPPLADDGLPVPAEIAGGRRTPVLVVDAAIEALHVHIHAGPLDRRDLAVAQPAQPAITATALEEDDVTVGSPLGIVLVVVVHVPEVVLAVGVGHG